MFVTLRKLVLVMVFFIDYFLYKKQIKPPAILKLENICMMVFNKPKYFADENLYGEIFGDNSLQGWTFINQN